MDYAELHAHSHFSLLDGASAPEALVAHAKEIGLRALAITDHDSLAGVIQFWTAAQRAGLHAVIGSEVTLADGQHLTLLAENQTGYAHLCRLLTQARGCLSTSPIGGEEWPGKTPPETTWEALAQHAAGLLALSGCRRGPVMGALAQRQPEQALQAAARLRDLFGPDHVWIELQHHELPDDDRLIRESLALAERLALPCVATNDVHYATPQECLLRDALIAIGHNQSLTEARRAGLLPANHTAALKSADEMARRFGELPQALHNSLEIAARCNVSLDFSKRRIPDYVVPDGQSELAYLYQLCHDRLPRRYPNLTARVLQQLAHELAVIEQTGLAGYFLTVWDITNFAQQNGIRYQGRGSAAGSVVAYLLGISAVDPIEHNLLFERFLSADRFTAPDVDVDFASDRREEVIQYVYQRYGADHVAMVCNTVTYQARSAVRDLGKALGFPMPVIDRLAKSLDTHSTTQAAEVIRQQVPEGERAAQHPLLLLADLMQQIDGCPRHLSIHVGGMVITALPLNEVVPLERATMPNRVICQWDKNSVEDAGLIKIDILSLRTLGMLSEALELAGNPELPTRFDDPALYAMLQKADTIGTFQVESRAQQQLLPRLKPERFEDIVIQVAIVRPGPIHGDSVHPFLRRRAGEELVQYLHPLLKPILEETLGVIIYQEQAVRIAMALAGFTPGEADHLRRCLGRYGGGELTPALREIGERFLAGATRAGIDDATAAAIFVQLSHFAGYGLCKSHASSFALLAYFTLWLKHYYPAAFYCALLNHEPLGFYSPEVVIGDARRHGTTFLPPDVRFSDWKYTLAQNDVPGGVPLSPIRIGLQSVAGLGEQGWLRIAEARGQAPFTDLRDLCQRTRLPQAALSDLIRAGTCDAFGERRQLLWALGEIDYRPEELPLVAPITPVDLPDLDDLEQIRWEYELLGFSPNGQIVGRYRTLLQRAGALHIAEAKQRKAESWVRVGGMVVIKQHPPTARGVVFLSLEDESGLVDIIVQPATYERLKPLLRNERFLIIDGILQQASGAVSILLTRANALFKQDAPGAAYARISL